MDRETQASIIAATQVIILRLRMNVMFLCVFLILRFRRESRKRKRLTRYNTLDKGSVFEDKLVSMMGSFMKETNDAIREMSSAIRSLKEVDPLVTKVFPALEEIPGFTMDQRVDVARHIVISRTHLALFFSMDVAGKKSFIKQILSRVN